MLPLWATTLFSQQPATTASLSDEVARYEHVLASAYAHDALGVVALVAKRKGGSFCCPLRI
jgi:hypothetical protein